MRKAWVLGVLVASISILQCVSGQTQPNAGMGTVPLQDNGQPQVDAQFNQAHMQGEPAREGTPHFATVGDSQQANGQPQAGTVPNPDPNTAQIQAERMRIQALQAQQRAQQAQRQADQALRRVQQQQKAQQQALQAQQAHQAQQVPHPSANPQQPYQQQQAQQPPNPPTNPQQQFYQQPPNPSPNPQQQPYQHQQPNPQVNQNVNPNQGGPNPNQYRYQRQEYQNPNQDQATYRRDGSVSRTNEIRNQQFQRSADVSRRVRVGQFKYYTFELKTTEQFYVDVPLNQQFFIKCSIYVDENNHYKQIENVERQTQSRFTIMQNNQRLVADEKFYFQAAATFNAMALTRYIIKFYNSGRQKLINVELKYLTQAAHVDDKLSTEDTGHFATAVNRMYAQFDQAMNQFRRLWFYDYKRTKEMADLSKVYYIYEIVEILVAGVVAVLQVRMVNKLLKGSNNIV